MKQAVLSTLAHYEAERGIPLSAFEVYKYLHKIEQKNLTTGSLSFLDLLKYIKKLLEENTIKEKNGFYFLASSKKRDHYERRIVNDKTSIKKWRKARKMIYLMQVIPFVRSISVAGSLSMNNTTQKSDIDLFITTKKGRIWIVRTLSMLLMQIIGQRRHNKSIDDKICLNYYMSENSLPDVKNLASANVFLRTVPMLNKKTYKEFYKKNTFWIGDYLQSPEEKFEMENLRKIKPNIFFKFKRKFLELILAKWIGNALEKYFANWQKKRIEKKIEKEKNVSNLIFTENILMFHWPKPRNEEVLRKHKEILNTLHF